MHPPVVLRETVQGGCCLCLYTAAVRTAHWLFILLVGKVRGLDQMSSEAVLHPTFYDNGTWKQ